jgi:hypothetical protein
MSATWNIAISCGTFRRVSVLNGPNKSSLPEAGTTLTSTPYQATSASGSMFLTAMAHLTTWLWCLIECALGAGGKNEVVGLHC